jgi:hypothetical protein
MYRASMPVRTAARIAASKPGDDGLTEMMVCEKQIVPGTPVFFYGE